MSSGVSDKVRLKSVSSATETSWKILPVALLHNDTFQKVNNKGADQSVVRKPQSVEAHINTAYVYLDFTPAF